MAAYPPRGLEPWDTELKGYLDGMDVRLPDSEASEGLAATIATEASTPGTDTHEAIGARATITSFYDDFTTKADATIAVGASYVSESGHTVSVTGQLAAQVTSGRFTHTRTNTATAQSTYLSVDIGVNAGDDAGYLWAEFDVPAGADPQNTLVLVAPGGVFGPPNFNDCAAHCAFGASTLKYDTLEALGAGLFTTTVLGRGQYTALTAAGGPLLGGAYRAEISIDGTQATVVDPRGKRWPMDPSAFVLARTTSYLTLQLYNNVGTFKALKVLRWGAEIQQRTKRGAYASAADVGAVATQPGRVIAAMQSTGASVATALTTSLSAKLLGLNISIPVSRRILIEGHAWFDESVPVVKMASALLIGCYLGGGTTYGRLSTVFSGYTPANATLDPITGSKTHDWGSIADGAMASTTVTVTGAALGNYADASMSVAVPAGMQLTAAVTAADTVTVTLTNHSGAPQDLAGGTLRATAQAATTAYAVGRLVPFALDLTIDPAFTIGDVIEVQIKAQASATGLFTFIDSGDASGGTSTLRRSTLKVTELAAA